MKIIIAGINQNCLHRSSTKSLKAFRVIHRLHFRDQCFRGLSFQGLLFSTSDRSQWDTKQVVGGLMRLRNIISRVMCFREIRVILTIWNCFKSGCGASVQQRKQNSFILFREKMKLTENRKPRKEQWHLRRCVINRTCKSREMHVAYKLPKITTLTRSILTSLKSVRDRVNQLSEPTTCWH